jgi:hypothetical protein
MLNDNLAASGGRSGDQEGRQALLIIIILKKRRQHKADLEETLAEFEASKRQYLLLTDAHYNIILLIHARSH